jgi:hypothetical protein
MPRSRRNGAVLTPTAATQPQPAAPPQPRIIHPEALHTLGEWQLLLGLPRHTLRREARLGRLRTSRRAGRLWALGCWVREWIEGAEVRRPPRGQAAPAGPPAAEVERDCG